MRLPDEAKQQLIREVGTISRVQGRGEIYQIGQWKVNLRTASEKNGYKYWFDVTPRYYEDKKVDFFIYVCGSPQTMYVFPRKDFANLIRGASLGGAKQVPNFDIYIDRQEIIPAGRPGSACTIGQYRNNFSLLM